MDNIDYTPTRSNSYGRVPPLEITLDTYPEGYINNKAIEYLISEFTFLTKNILSYEEACSYWIHNCNNQGIKCTKQEVQEAYDICYGYGCEFEWN